MTRPAAAMVNLLGDLWTPETPAWSQVLELAHAALHLYGKSAPRAGRKMGHITTWAHDPGAAATLALRARASLNPA
jgi:5-(carboxyamino)imidazole ribonucleotide synthase